MTESRPEFKDSEDEDRPSPKPIQQVSAISYIRSGVFVLIIFGFMLGAIVCWADKSKLSLLEHRTLAAFPHLRLNTASIRAFPAQFEAFFSDRFPLRFQMVALTNLVKWKALDVSGSDKVLVGKNDWLFYLDGGNAEFLRRENLAPDKLNLFVNTFERRRDWLAQHNIKYLLVFVPCKCEVYRENVPNQYKPMHNDSMQDQLITALRKRSQVEVVDLRKDLRAAKKVLGMPLYLQTDSHWNELGAFVAYQTLIKPLSKHFPVIKPLSWDDVDLSVRNQVGGDLSGMLGLRQQTTDPAVNVKNVFQRWTFSCNPLVPNFNNPTQFFQPFATEVYGSGLPRAYFIRDSFTINMQPYLSQHFSRAFYHWNYFRNPDDDFLADEILNENPDIVVQEMAENLIARDVMPNPREVEPTPPNSYCLSSSSISILKTKVQ
jgi:hypothetical protein